ncbi:FG-GAP repeat protein [Myxococcota bacterium]|nr:FG-GAP repeat protein [Myxococcota bacterium]MBU1382493.1 FG-GAP repeat protein [Myxococcota bacterium]MBU1497945.1 FG-GAP repeat protein [Myxococcota bacterium]
MKKLFLIMLMASMAIFSCDDDDDTNNNNSNNTNNTNCACGITIDTINGVNLDEVTLLTAGQDDQNAEMDGFQITVTVSVSTEASCIPPDGAEVTLTGGLENATGTLSGNTVTFNDYTIPSGAGILNLRAIVPNCQSEPTDIRLSTAGIPECMIYSGIESNEIYVCPDDDLVPNQIGLQRVVTVRCVDVASGTNVAFNVNGNLQATESLSVGGEAQAVITLPVTGICENSINVSISVDTGSGVLTDSVSTGESCCEGVVPCSLGWVEGTHYVTGTPVGQDTMNKTTDMDAVTAGHQASFSVTTLAEFTDDVAILADNGSGTFTEICRENSISGNTATFDCTVPDGTVAIKPVCYQATTEIEDPSQIHHVYVDTVAPGCSNDFSCTVSNYHEVDIDCSWTLPGTAGVDEVLADTEVRYTSNYDQAGCLADSSGIFSGGWASLDEVPGSSALSGGDPGDFVSQVFTPFVPSSGYCIGTKVMDMAGNLSECTATSWTGSVYPDYLTIEGQLNQTQFGSAVTGVDLNCDGRKDLVVGAPNGYADAGCTAGMCTGDGLVYVFFAKETGGYNATPDLTLVYDVPAVAGNTSYVYFGLSVQGIGNFTQHIDDGTNDSVACEDLAIGALWDFQDDPSTWLLPGAVYVLKGRPQARWTASEYHTANNAANGFDLVIRYDATDYADYWYYFEEFGHRIAAIGNFNGDAYGDIAISAPGAMPSGAVYVMNSFAVPFKSGTSDPVIRFAPDDMDAAILGTASINNADPDLAAYENLGESMSALGDLNGDGLDDFIIGAPGCNSGLGYQAGKAFIVMGGQSGIIDTATYSGTGLVTITQDALVSGTDCFGWAVAGIGDFNDDGYNDLAISDKGYDRPSTNAYSEGGVFVFFGDGSVADMTTASASMKMRSEWPLSTDDNFGRSVAPSVGTLNTPKGDFNNDGIPDLLIGTQHFGSYHGSAFVWYGNGGYVADTNPTSWLTYEQATFWFLPAGLYGYWGYNVRWLGDINLDGYTDLVVGDPGWDSFYGGPGANPLKGRVTVIY